MNRSVCAFARSVFACVAAAFIYVSIVHAQVAGPATVMKSDFAKTTALDKIFAESKEVPNDSVTHYKIEAMWKIFLMTPDRKTADNMNRALRAKGGFNFDKAFGLLNGVIVRHPDYVEAWNQRATIRFLQRDFNAALADCEKVLELEPRHLGCLSSTAIIHIRHKKDNDLARKALARALELQPRIAEKSLLLEIPEGSRRIGRIWGCLPISAPF